MATPQITIANLDGRLKGVLKDAKAAKTELMSIRDTSPINMEVKQEITMVVNALEGACSRWEKVYNKYRR